MEEKRTQGEREQKQWRQPRTLKLQNNVKIQKIHSKDSPVELVEVVVEEVGGAVEREGGDWEVGGTDEVGGEGVADSAAARRKQF